MADLQVVHHATLSGLSVAILDDLLSSYGIAGIPDDNANESEKIAAVWCYLGGVPRLTY